MELFKLLGTIAINNSEANKALNDTSGKARDTGRAIEDASDSGDNAGGRWSSAFKKIGTGVAVMGKAIAAGTVATGAAVAGLVTKSVQAYASYEQLVGGVDTLFKESSAKVQEYAKNAFNTAGLSANAYMETVTSFSASLLQSLGGDTEKAADYANRAIIDMSDNANKMGTDMTMIQNAYQGFAKQNYTMLDNLKLGYGGTKEEMARLIADASKMKDVQKELGITVDENSMSFGNIVNAISVMQKSMGIAGTTAAEAASTISGSLASVKGAWQNLLVAVSSDDLPFDDYVKAFVDSAAVMLENMMPRISQALEGVVQLIDKLAPVILGKIPELLSTLLPSIVNATSGILNSIVEVIPGIASALGEMLPAITDAFLQVFNGITSAIPEILQIVFDVIQQIANALYDALPELLPAILGSILDIVSLLVENIPTVIDAVLLVVYGIIDALPDMLQTLADRIPEILNDLLYGVLPELLPTLVELLSEMATQAIYSLVDALPAIAGALAYIVEALGSELPVLIPMLVDGVVSIIEMLVSYLPDIIPPLVDAVVMIVTELTEQLPVIIPMLIEATISIVMALVDALPTIIQVLIQALPAILQSVWDAIVMVFQNLPEWFMQIFDGVVLAITTLLAPVGEWINTNVVQPVVGFFQDLWNGIKAVWDGICNVITIAVRLIGSILNAAFQIITLPFRFIWENCKEYVFAAFEWIKEKIDIAINFIKELIQVGFTFIKDKIITPVNEAKNKAVEAFNIIKAQIQEKITAVRDKVSEIFNRVKSIISTIVNDIKTKVSTVFNSVKSIVGSIFDSIKDKMTKPIEKARDLIKGIVDKIKGFFSGMKLSFPNIKLPHFGISPKGWKIGDLMEGSIPKLSIDWYAEAMRNPMIMTKPTIFGYDAGTGKLMGGGEAGTEVVSGANTLMNMIQGAVAGQNNALVGILYQILEAILAMDANMGGNLREALAGTAFTVNNREFARLVKAVN